MPKTQGFAAGKRFLNSSTRHQVYVERYTLSVVRRMLALLNRTDSDLIDRIQALDENSATRGRLEDVLASVQELNKRVTSDLKRQLAGELTAFGAYEGEAIAKIATSSFGVQWQGPTLEQLRAAALSRPFQNIHLKFAKLDEHLDEYGNRRGALIRDTIRRNFLTGQGVDQTVRELRGTRALQYRDGLLETSRRTTETIVRTAMNHTATAAREEVYKVNGHLITGVQWVSVLDARTSSICRAYDGQVFESNEGPRPPAHPNCRSTTIPVIKGEDPIDKKTYGEWLGEQDKSTVEEVLGKSKAKLFLKGDLPLDRFVDNSGKEYTLEQLKAKESTASEKAGLDK